ncbi:MAG: PorT family protein [Bacteroidetes bacterium]|nr:PorT family protein [Bacteroidota bacterium]
MRRIAFIFAGIFMLSCNSFAQLPFSLGLKVGFNSSKMLTEFSSFGEVKDQAKTGFLAGAFLRINLPVVYLQPEVYFTKKGGNFQSAIIPQFQNQTFTQQTVLNTIDVPILVGVKLINLKAFNFRIMTGPVISFVTSKDVSYQVNGVNLGNAPNSAAYKSTIWGIQAGAGFDVLNFSLDVRYEWGLNNISDTPDITSKTKLLNVSLGMKLF